MTNETFAVAYIVAGAVVGLLLPSAAQAKRDRPEAFTWVSYVFFFFFFTSLWPLTLLLSAAGSTRKWWFGP